MTNRHRAELIRIHIMTIQFWNVQRKGANFSPNNPTTERFKDAAKAGIVIARLASNKWLNGRPEAELGDFLLGPKDQYSGIVEKDLQHLLKVLNDADAQPPFAPV